MAAISYTDGVLTIRTLGPDDLEQHLSAVDDAQMNWLWDPGDREKYEARTPEAQRAGMLASHLVIHQDNEPSLRVAAAVGAAEVERYVDEHGQPMVRHVLQL